MAVIVAMLLVPGCGPPAAPKLSPAPSAPGGPDQILKDVTERFIRDVAVTDIDRLRLYFPADVKVNIAEQLELYFQMPIRKIRIYNWDAQGIVVDRSPDNRSARTGISVWFTQDNGQQLLKKGIVLNWVARGDSSDLFSLVPLSKASD